MSFLLEHQNKHTPSTPIPHANRIEPLSGIADDAHLFALFAILAREAGRDDLHAEFTRRAANAPHTHAPLTTTAQTPLPSPEADRLQQSGCRLLRSGKLPEAEAAFRQAIKLDPSCAEAHGNLGVLFAQQRKLPEAEAAFLLAIRFGPTNLTMYVNLATAILEQGRPQEGECWARQAIQLNPELPEPHRLLGSALEARKQHDAAEAAYREAIRLDPKHVDAHYKLGRLLTRRHKPKEAEPILREAVKLKPTHASAWHTLAQVLSETDRHPEAVDCAREAVKHDPKSSDLHNSLGIALAACEKFAEAEAAYRESLRLNPKNASAHSNLGNSVRAQGRPDEAEVSLREALRLSPKYAEAHNNLGIVLVQLGREQEGVQHYDEAIKLKPDYPEAHMNRSLTYLCDGDFARGWPEYEWRLKVRPLKHKQTPGPRWDGSPIEGKKLLITSEQGLGDCIQFIRYAQLAKSRGATVTFDAPSPLKSLMATCPGLDRVPPKGEPITYDLHVPLLSLPSIFGVPPDAATATIPYFTPELERLEHWRKELANVPGLRVGIAWQGSKVHKGDRLRSVPLTRFAPLAAVPGVSLLSIQKGAGTEQLTDGSANGMGILDFGSKTAPEMIDVAALMMNLDLIVSIDTAVIHLAGALGRPTWVAIPYAPDWRWQRNREDTIWYPTMRLFRQTTRGEWDSVFGRMAAALAGMVRR